MLDYTFRTESAQYARVDKEYTYANVQVRRVNISIIEWQGGGEDTLISFLLATEQKYK